MYPLLQEEQRYGALPFKGRAGVGMVFFDNSDEPPPPPNLPLEGGGAKKDLAQTPIRTSMLRAHNLPLKEA
jgi:hypothetical protein